MKKTMKWAGIVLGGLIALLFLAGVALYPIGMEKLTRTYPDIPVEMVDIPTGPDAAARGRDIAISWGCEACHGEDLSGMLFVDAPIIGTFSVPNLTSGEGGIGSAYTDIDWVRAIRHGVKPNSQIEIFMYDYYSTMSDPDLGALIAYLKQIPPVDSDYPPMRFGSIFPIAPAIGLFTPAAEVIDHSVPRPADPVPGATIEYGRYLSVTCAECHRTNLADKLEDWSQEDFVRALRTGVLPDGKQINPAMSLNIFGEMNDTEVAALWLYLKSLSR